MFINSFVKQIWFLLLAFVKCFDRRHVVQIPLHNIMCYTALNFLNASRTITTTFPTILRTRTGVIL